jgi:hypothetical protein
MIFFFYQCTFAQLLTQIVLHETHSAETYSCRDQATKSRVYSPLVGDTLEFLNLCAIPLNVVNKDTGRYADPQASEHHPLLARQLQEEAQVLTTRYLVS